MTWGLSVLDTGGDSVHGNSWHYSALFCMGLFSPLLHGLSSSWPFGTMQSVSPVGYSTTVHAGPSLSISIGNCQPTHEVGLPMGSDRSSREYFQIYWAPITTCGNPIRRLGLASQPILTLVLSISIVALPRNFQAGSSQHSFRTIHHCDFSGHSNWVYSVHLNLRLFCLSIWASQFRAWIWSVLFNTALDLSVHFNVIYSAHTNHGLPSKLCMCPACGPIPS